MKPAAQIATILLTAVVTVTVISIAPTTGPTAKRFDFLSALKVKKKKPEAVAVQPSLHDTASHNAEQETAVAFVDTVSYRFGGLELFFRALDGVRDSGKTVHIGYFGDSMIEGDLLTQDLRRLFQKRFGGHGVGFVPVTSIVAGFRATIRHDFNARWTTFDFALNKPPIGTVGPSGHLFVAQPDALVTYKSTEYAFRKAELFYNGAAAGTIAVNTDGSADTLQLENGFVKTLRDRPFKKITLTCIAGNPELYGVNFESGAGVYVDNFSFRGCSGLPLSGISENVLRGFDRALDYRLIVLHYGMNVVSHEMSDYGWYATRMRRTVQHLKRCFPNASFLIVGMSDKAHYAEGAWSSEPNVLRFIAAQKSLAQNESAAFWDLYEKMGGENSIVSWANDSVPKLANADYTHLTGHGTRKVARLLFNDLMLQYDKRARETERVILSQHR